MRVDLNRTKQVAVLAKEFDWTWTIADLPAFAERLGWELANLDQSSVALTTNLDVNRADATVYASDAIQLGTARSLDGIWFFASDVVLDDSEVGPAMSRAFESIAQKVFNVVGQRPSGWWIEPSRGLRWDLPNLVLKVTTSGRSVSVKLINPVYQGLRDEIDKQLEQEASPDLDTVWHF